MLASLQDASAGQGVALALEDGEWVVLARQEPGAAPVALRTGLRAKQDRWQSVSLHLALAERRVTVRVGPAATVIPGPGRPLPAQEATLDAGAARFDGQPFTHLCLGALWRGHPGQGYNGLIEAPALSAGGQASSCNCSPSGTWPTPCRNRPCPARSPACPR